MINLLRFIGFRHLFNKKLRTLLTLLGIAVGITLFSSIALINKATLAAFKENIDAISGQADLVITAGDAGFSEDLLRTVEETSGVKNAVPVVEENTRLVKTDGSTDLLVILGVDLLRESAVRTYKMADSQIMDDPLIFLNQPDSVVLSKQLADKLGLKIDSKLKVLTARGATILTVRGLLDFEGPAKAYGGAIAIMDLDATRYSFGRENNLDRIDVVLRDKTQIAAVTETLQQQLGSSFNVHPPQSFNPEKLVGVYQKILTLIASLALIVGLLLVANTTNISVFERRREIGILRSLGASRFGILFVFISEAVTVGFISSLIGAGGGGWLARRLVASVSEALSSQAMMKIPEPQIHYDFSDFILFVGLGVAATFVAALWPAYKANQVQPIEAIRKMAPQTNYKNPYLNPITLFSRGLRLLFPNVTNRLSQDNLNRDLGRTFSNVSTLALGLSLVVIISTVNMSFSESIGGWIERVLRSDLVISSAGSLFSLQTQPLHEELLNQIAELPEVKNNLASPVFGMRFLHFQHEGRRIGIKAFDNPGEASKYSFLDLETSEALSVGRELFDASKNVAVVSYSFAEHFKKKIGDTIEMQTPSGPLHVRILALVNDYSSNEGVIYLNRVVYKKIFNDPLVTIVYIRLQPSADATALRQNIESSLKGTHNLQILLNRELKKEFRSYIDRSFSYSKAIETAALICALFSMLNLLFISVVERTREIGLMRAIGLTRGQTFRIIIIEALTQGFMASLLALAVGALFSYIWIHFVMADLLGWSIDVHFNSETIVMVVVMGLFISLMAALMPAQRASTIEIKEALAYE